MSAVQNILIPMGAMALFILLAGALIFIIWAILRAVFKNFGLWWKYKVRKKDYNEQDVDWCMGAIERGIDRVGIKKHLLLNNQSKRRTNEILFVYDQVLKKLQGGENNDRQFRKSDEQIEKIKKAE